MPQADEEFLTGPHQPSKEERKLVRKLDRRILPLTCLLYLCAYMDRSNLGNARLQGLPEDVLEGDRTGKLFDWVNSAFFLTYILFQVPATLASKLVRPRIWMSAAALGWGLSSTLMATSFNFSGLFVARLFLGVFEAAFAPTIPLYFTLFYTKHEFGLRMACFLGCSAAAGACGGLIAFAIQHIDSPVSNWRLLFIIEGLPTLFLAVITFFLLPDRPESTKFFTESERSLAVERANRGTSSDSGATVTKRHIYAAFTDWKIYVAGVIYFGLSCALGSISAFLPTIIQTFGKTNAEAQLLTVPPYVVAAVLLITLSHVSDKLQMRGIFLVCASTLSGLGYILLLVVTSNNRVRYFAVFCIVSGTYTTIGIIVTWFAYNLGSETKRAAGIPLFMVIGQTGSILGSHIFPKTEGPLYSKGFTVCCALAFLCALCCGILSATYSLENKRRDSIHGTPTSTQVDTRELADKTPDFRYVL